MKRWTSALLIASVALSLAVPAARTQTGGGQSNYVFRFNTGISGVFLSTSIFASEAPLNLGACTTNEKINGLLSCAVNCNNDAVCLLEVSGPSGASVSDVMEKVSETPVGASPSPTASPVPGGGTAGLGIWVLTDPDASSRERRVAAYNHAG